MANLLNTINEAFRSLNLVLNSGPNKTEIQRVKKVAETSVTTVYKRRDEIESGFKQLVDTTTDVVDQLAESIPDQIINEPTIAQLNQKASEKDLVKTINASIKARLENIIGKTSLCADGFMDVIVIDGHPESLAETLKNKCPSLSSRQVKELVEKNVRKEIDEQENDDDVKDPIEVIVENVFTSSSRINSVFNNLKDNATNLVNSLNQGFSSTIENIIEDTFSPVKLALGKVTYINGQSQVIVKEDLQRIIELKQKGDILSAAKILQKYSDKTLDELSEVIRKINNKASSKLVPVSQNTKNLNVQRTDKILNAWSEINPKENEVFTPIQGNEISVEIKELQREVTQVVVQFVGGKGASISAHHRAYVKKYDIGFNGHFYVGSDAIVYRGRPLEIEASNKPNSIINNNNLRTILILVSINQKSKSNKVTPAQQSELIELLGQIIEAKPGIQIFGASDVGWVSSSEFNALNVPLIVKQKFNKSNIANYNPKVRDPLTAVELASFITGSGDMGSGGLY